MTSYRKSRPVSVYFSPKALEIVEQYKEHSGYGSLSRTVEEIILAYDKSYNTLLGTFAVGGLQETVGNPATIIMLLMNILNNYFDLRKGHPLFI